MAKKAACPETDAPLFVERYDNPLRYLVTSEVEADIKYLVELGNKQFPGGRCDCDDYRFRIEPAVTRGQRPECGRTFCKHIIAVVDFCEKAKRATPKNRPSPTRSKATARSRGRR